MGQGMSRLVAYLSLVDGRCCCDAARQTYHSQQAQNLGTFELTHGGDSVEKLENSDHAFSRQIPPHLKSHPSLDGEGHERATRRQCRALADPLAKVFDRFSTAGYFNTSRQKRSFSTLSGQCGLWKASPMHEK